MNRRKFLASVTGMPSVRRSRAARNVLLMAGVDPACLASEGIHFANAYCPTASFHSGLSAIHTGLHNHASGHYGYADDFHHFSLMAHVRPLSSLLKDAGYRTGYTGDIHVHPQDRFRWDAECDAASFFRAAGPWFLYAGSEDAIEALRDSGLLDSTLIILIGPVVKSSEFGAVRVPLIVRAPELPQRAFINRRLTSWTDIAPTILDWTGAQFPPYPLHGCSVFDKRCDRVFFSHTFDDISAYNPMRGVRTPRHTYILNLFPEVSGRPPEELYEASDGKRNLIGLSRYSATLEKLRSEVRSFREQTYDPWLIHENYRC